MNSDFGETNDLSARMPDRTAELTTALHRWLDRMDADLPIANPKYDPQAKPPPSRNWGKSDEEIQENLRKLIDRQE